MRKSTKSIDMIKVQEIRAKAVLVLEQANKVLELPKHCGDCFTVHKRNLIARVEGREATGCCGNCARESGYMVVQGVHLDQGDTMSVSQFKVMKEKYNFDEISGFLGQMGCNIPREERSEICNSFLCDHITSFVTDKQYFAKRLLSDLSKLIRDCNNLYSTKRSTDKHAVYSENVLPKEHALDILLKHGLSVKLEYVFGGNIHTLWHEGQAIVDGKLSTANKKRIISQISKSNLNRQNVIKSKREAIKSKREAIKKLHDEINKLKLSIKPPPPKLKDITLDTLEVIRNFQYY